MTYFIYYDVLQVIHVAVNKINKSYFFYKAEKELIKYAYHILNIHFLLMDLRFISYLAYGE